ncbi:MAG: S9 family peptidase [Sphingomonadales bacterium]|nr:S9 family peptidase [Sphingomonadales bacterium]PIX66895.1 MAG: S9 family peptidase [Sphingomonadales bacterium CG_4_10_14_3_um_filter_58_15]NCO98898.1 S9 family peptidase [Sphingomonadales bacterium]NCP44408.1 S9 family peptidase [Sphingomonadales bacterium]NCP48803.1 S9 family peptidase [Sphingomonadales bacterium]
MIRKWSTAMMMAATMIAGPSPALAQDAAPKPSALVADQIPGIPLDMVERTRPYMEYRTASFVDWDPKSGAMLVSTRFADTSQLHRVAAPMRQREQLTFGSEPVYSARYAPDGSALLFEKDSGGNEVDQIYALTNGRPEMLTDGTSRNSLGPWSSSGKLVAFGSNKRTGLYNDIYLMNPANPDSAKMLIASTGGGWFPIDFSPDDKQLLVFNYVSVSDNQLYLIDIAKGTSRKLTDSNKPVGYDGLKFAPDGRLWAASDNGSDVKRLGVLNLETSLFEPLVDEKIWDITDFDISKDGRWIAFEVNQAGRSVLKFYDVQNGTVRSVDTLPAGVISGVTFAPWGELGITLNSNQTGTDAYSVNPETLVVTRWTRSEIGGLDAAANVAPELIEIESFDGEKMSGFLYRPDPARHKGRRPLIISIHGGPEGQATPQFLGRNNYLVNELGIALFYPNVRGSTGFGKRFVALDNGPWLRENSVLDIGAFLDQLRGDRKIDRKRIAVTGGSYGGYMTLASMLRYGERLKAGLEVVGISNFVTFLENTQAYRRDLRRVEYGDERDPEQRAKLQEISPLVRASEISIPLMVVTGENDPRVPASEADQIVSAVRANGRPAWHLLAQNEGHGFRKKANADYQFWASLLFWQKYLLDEGK